jgi:hypothetical protein
VVEYSESNITDGGYEVVRVLLNGTMGAAKRCCTLPLPKKNCSLELYFLNISEATDIDSKISVKNASF